MSAVPISSLSPPQQSSFSRSTTSPRIFIQAYPATTRSPAAVTLELGVASGASDVYLKRLDSDYEKIKKFDGLVFQYFKVAKLHDEFPKQKLSKTGGLAPAFQKYFEDMLLSIPGIFIFPGFVDLFQIDVAVFAQPAT
jgi:hypothetical protein